jgi:hypothetical protein
MKKETYETEYDRPNDVGSCMLFMLRLCSENQLLMAVTLSLDSRCKKNISCAHLNQCTSWLREGYELTSLESPSIAAAHLDSDAYSLEYRRYLVGVPYVRQICGHLVRGQPASVTSKMYT